VRGTSKISVVEELCSDCEFFDSGIDLLGWFLAKEAWRSELEVASGKGVLIGICLDVDDTSFRVERAKLDKDSTTDLKEYIVRFLFLAARPSSF